MSTNNEQSGILAEDSGYLRLIYACGTHQKSAVSRKTCGGQIGATVAPAAKTSYCEHRVHFPATSVTRRCCSKDPRPDGSQQEMASSTRARRRIRMTPPFLKEEDSREEGMPQNYFMNAKDIKLLLTKIDVLKKRQTGLAYLSSKAVSAGFLWLFLPLTRALSL